MAKDPAFLFYYQDFLVGTAFMTPSEKGHYISILCHMADKGKLSEYEIKSICGDEFTERLRAKFVVDENGFFLNQRLLLEVEKRKGFCNSRRVNRLKKKDMKKKCKTYVRHMENENINENKDKEIKKGIVKGENPEKQANEIAEREKWFDELWQNYPNKDGRKHAKRHFLATVKTARDLELIKKALQVYLGSERVRHGFVKNGSTWFNDWETWVNWQEPKREETDAERDARIIAKIAKG